MVYCCGGATVIGVLSGLGLHFANTRHNIAVRLQSLVPGAAGLGGWEVLLH
jgi:hypothetical protein